MIETFTWPATTQTTGQGQFAVSSAEFGDGYSQDAKKGINNLRDSYTVQVIGTEKEVQPALDFIKAMGGAIAFYWKPALSPRGTFKCKQWSWSQQGSIFVLTLQFERGYTP